MISIVIPTYDQQGYGPVMVQQLLASILKQTITCEYEVVVSDNATNDLIKKVCEQFTTLPIRYEVNENRGASENINNCIDLAKFDKVKIMCMDDMFALDNSIDLFAAALDNHSWVISNSVRMREGGEVYDRQDTAYNHNRFDTNITGMPSVTGWRKCDLRFNVKLKTVCDMYFYYQLYELYGQPGIIKQYSIKQRFWRGALSHNQPRNLEGEIKFLKENGMIK